MTYAIRLFYGKAGFYIMVFVDDQSNFMSINHRRYTDNLEKT